MKFILSLDEINFTCRITREVGSGGPYEKAYLRAYNHEMVESGTGYRITLAHQHGVLSHHLFPFFLLLDDHYRLPTVMPVTYPWTNFPARYEQLNGRRYDPDFALIPR
jgi:hypothetical protein